jgi:septal ring factor EnvC (AmiA/AmiB activator)
MTDWSRFLRVAAVCLLVRSLDLRLGAAATAGDEARAPARVYTNEDLARLSARRGDTGVESRPAAAAPAAPPAEPARDGGESHWRAEAARVRQRVEPWREAAADLRVEIAARQAEPGVRPYTDPKVRALQRRLEMLERRIRDAEDRLEERARRAGALPGWLR